jgi:DNA mismatch endonuclease (patch repair protein)
VSTWSTTRPADDAWKAPTGRSRAECAREQDTAAGGRDNRMIRLGDRTVTASVALRVQPNSRRIYAYLRWSDAGRTYERYLGDVDAHDRATNLRRAWFVAQQTNATEEPGSKSA